MLEKGKQLKNFQYNKTRCSQWHLLVICYVSLFHIPDIKYGKLITPIPDFWDTAKEN